MHIVWSPSTVELISGACGFLATMPTSPRYSPKTGWNTEISGMQKSRKNEVARKSRPTKDATDDNSEKRVHREKSKNKQDRSKSRSKRIPESISIKNTTHKKNRSIPDSISIDTRKSSKSKKSTKSGRSSRSKRRNVASSELRISRSKSPRKILEAARALVKRAKSRSRRRLAVEDGPRSSDDDTSSKPRSKSTMSVGEGEEIVKRTGDKFALKKSKSKSARAVTECEVSPPKAKAETKEKSSPKSKSEGNEENRDTVMSMPVRNLSSDTLESFLAMRVTKTPDGKADELSRGAYSIASKLLHSKTKKNVTSAPLGQMSGLETGSVFTSTPSEWLPNAPQSKEEARLFWEKEPKPLASAGTSMEKGIQKTARETAAGLKTGLQQEGHQACTSSRRRSRSSKHKELKKKHNGVDGRMSSTLSRNNETRKKESGRRPKSSKKPDDNKEEHSHGKEGKKSKNRTNRDKSTGDREKGMSRSSRPCSGDRMESDSRSFSMGNDLGSKASHADIPGGSRPGLSRNSSWRPPAVRREQSTGMLHLPPKKASTLLGSTGECDDEDEVSLSLGPSRRSTRGATRRKPEMEEKATAYTEHDIFSSYTWSLSTQDLHKIQRERLILKERIRDTPLFRAYRRIEALG